MALLSEDLRIPPISFQSKPIFKNDFFFFFRPTRVGAGCSYFFAFLSFLILSLAKMCCCHAYWSSLPLGSRGHYAATLALGGKSGVHHDLARDKLNSKRLYQQTRLFYLFADSREGSLSVASPLSPPSPPFLLGSQ